MVKRFHQSAGWQFDFETLFTMGNFIVCTVILTVVYNSDEDGRFSAFIKCTHILFDTIIHATPTNISAISNHMNLKTNPITASSAEAAKH